MHNYGSHTCILVDSLQVRETEERDRRAYEERLQEIRQNTAKEARAHYLQCLHQMVNSKNTTGSHDGTTGSHDGSCEFSDGSCGFSDGSNDLPLESPGTTRALGDKQQHARKPPKGHSPSPKQPKAPPPPHPPAGRLLEKTRNDRRKESRRTATASITTKPSQVGVSKFVPKTKLILHTEYKSPSTTKVVSPSRGVATEGVSARGHVYWAKEPEKTKPGRLRVASSGRGPSGRGPSGGPGLGRSRGPSGRVSEHGHHQ